MTQPSEEAIRKACEEAGVDANEFIALYQSAPGIVVNYPWMNAILALARRIEAEREAVPVAWLYEYADRVGGDTRVFEDLQQSIQYSRDAGWTETPLYAAPPKEPTT